MKALYFLLVVSVLGVSGGKLSDILESSTKKRPGIHHVAVSANAKAAPRKDKNGHFEFKETEDISFIVEGVMDKRVKLTKSNINPRKPEVARTRGKREESVVYESREEAMVCRKECDVDTDTCDFYCTMATAENGYYISSNGRALTIRVSQGTIDNHPLEPPTGTRKETLVRQLEMLHSLYERERRDIPSVSDTGVVKVLMAPDKAYMDRFLLFANGDVDEAKTEVTRFLTLAVNEMTMAYQSLKSYGLTMTIRSTVRTLDLAVYLADIVFPEVDGSGLGFVNPQWSEESLVDGEFQFRYDDGIGYNKGLESFRQWVMSYSSPVRYDHAVALTGHQIHQIVNGKYYYPTGIAWTGTICSSGSTSTGYHTSMVTLYGAQGRLLAHEVAHSFGAAHDAVSPCPPFQYLMSPSTVIPSADTVETYYTMSTCSANNIRDYLVGIPSYDFVWTCLYDTSLSQSQFVDQYCNQGLRGDDFTLDEQCRLTYGGQSFVCSPDNFLTENNYVGQCHRETSHPLYCHRPKDGECMAIPEVADGTKCSIDGKLGTNICFKGNCVNAADLCSTATTVIVTIPPTTTVAPSTTTTKPSTSSTPKVTTTTTTTSTAATSPTTVITTTKPTTTTTTQEPISTRTTTEPTTTSVPELTTTTAAHTTTITKTTTKLPTTTTTLTTTNFTTITQTTRTTTPEPTTTKTATTTLTPTSTTPVGSGLCYCDVSDDRECCEQRRNTDGSCCFGCERKGRNCKQK